MVMEKEQENAEANEGVTEADALRKENEKLAQEIKLREAAITRLEQITATQNTEIEALKKSIEGAGERREEMEKFLAGAVAAYRKVLVGANPGVVAELITGDSIEAMEESVKSARALVERVRQGMEAEIARTRVPAGAPPRTTPDLAGLTPREKIQYGIGGG
ncbi:MAG: hypothetical protein A2Z29_00530 [Chloroflexi bacterium RBG_16_56_11]|nr:MAG: hypothetical protein A2Z29_00530 [Chloroflexi bacterium RBG_16_56_11]